jgi:hypothetical protein
MIDFAAFGNCTSLTSVTIPDSVTEIGVFVFNGCTSLTGIYVDENNPNYSSDSFGVLFNKSQSEIVCVPGAIVEYAIPNTVEKICDNAFAYCESLKSVTIPNSVKTIDDNAFAHCTTLTNVAIPSSVTKINYFAFNSCTSLASVTIPDSVTEIGYDAFYGCTSLTDVYYEGSEEQWNGIKIGSANEPLANATIHYNYAPAHPAGDINGDGKVENSDLVTIARYIVGLTDGDIKTAVEAYADMNNDGKVDNLDIVTVARKIVGLE